MRSLGILLLGCIATVANATEDETIEERLERLEESLASTTAENSDLKRRLGDRSQASLDEEIDTYLEETTTPTATRDGAFLTFYGFLRLDAYYNSARMDSAIAPTVVLPETDGNRNDDQFTMAIRQTRFGMLFDFKKIGSLDATGVLELDFAAASDGFLSLLRLRLAYVQLASENWWLRLGQDWDVISPLNPSINDESLQLLAGNIAERRPMIRWFSWLGQSAGSVDIALAPSGTFNVQDLDGGGAGSELDGFDSGVPQVQIRIAWQESRTDGAAVGVWGYIASFETDSSFGGDHHFLPWVVGVDFKVPFGERFTLLGEAWFGQALADMGGNIGQSINTATGQEIRGPGGWVELDFRPNEDWQFYIGGSIDDPEDDRLAADAPAKNWAAYFGARRHFTKSFQLVLGLTYWETTYRDGGLGNALRINIWTSFDF